jgi:hypothetical protein
MIEEVVREKFETWALKQGYNLTRHPNNSDFYYIRDVSALWVCFTTAYAMGRVDENESIKELIDTDWDDSATEAIIERTTDLDD